MATRTAIQLDAETFDLGTHNGMITIQSPTGDHRTFKISTQKEDAKFAPGERIVSLLIGPDRSDYQSWTKFGFVRHDHISVWRKFVGSDGQPSQYERLARMLERPHAYAAKGARYMVEAHCRRCNRSLTNPTSIDSGYGPECITMV